MLEDSKVAEYPKYVPNPIENTVETDAIKANAIISVSELKPKSNSKYKTAEYVPKAVTKVVEETKAEPSSPVIAFTPPPPPEIIEVIQAIKEPKPSSRSNSSSKSQSSKDKVKSSSKSSSHNSSSSKHKSSSSSRRHSSSSRSHKSSSRDDKDIKDKKSSSSSSSNHKSDHKEKRRHSSDSDSRRKDRKSSSNGHSKKRESSTDVHPVELESKKPKLANVPVPESNESKWIDSLDAKELERILGSDDDDVEAQCKLIFEEYDEAPPRPTEPPQTDPVDHQQRHLEEESNFKDLMRKKRVAHELPSGSRPIERSFQTKPNHLQNALQSIYQRAEVARKERAEEEEKALNEWDTQSKILEKYMPESAGTSPNSATPQRRPFVAPVSNIIALQNAKKKIEELKMLNDQKTGARTAPKVTINNVTKRVAHKTSVAPTERVAPPVLEAHSTKINFNLRMQYYLMMVKPCLDIYSTCEDAWERAQSEELNVWRKCSSSVIYKSSATLAINKLRKESISAGNVNTQKNKVGRFVSFVIVYWGYYYE